MAVLEEYYDGKDRLIIDYDGDHTNDKHTIIPDGAVLRVPLFLADSAAQQHILGDSDDWSPEQAYHARKQHIANRWRSDPPSAGAPAASPGTPQATPAAQPDNDAYHALRLRRLENRWKEGI